MFFNLIRETELTVKKSILEQVNQFINFLGIANCKKINVDTQYGSIGLQKKLRIL